MTRYCASCDQNFEFNNGSNEKITKACKECGYGDCTENMLVNSSRAVPSVTPKDKPDQKDEKKEK